MISLTISNDTAFKVHCYHYQRFLLNLLWLRLDCCHVCMLFLYVVFCYRFYVQLPLTLCSVPHFQIVSKHLWHTCSSFFLSSLPHNWSLNLVYINCALNFDIVNLNIMTDIAFHLQLSENSLPWMHILKVINGKDMSVLLWFSI